MSSKIDTKEKKNEAGASDASVARSKQKLEDREVVCKGIKDTTSKLPYSSGYEAKYRRKNNV